MNDRLWLLSIAVLIIIFNCYFNYNSIHLLFWCAALAIAWRNKNKLDLESNPLSTVFGLTLTTWLLFRGAISVAQDDVIARTYPLISVVAICLLATKPRKLGQHWREIAIVGLTGIPGEHVFNLLPTTETISIIDAKISRLMLWYVGFDVSQVNNLVILPSGSIQIAGPCSSFALLGLMWQVCLVICLYFQLSKNHKLLLWLCCTLIAFGVNGIRLCLMALLVAGDRQEAFEYWHGSAGAEIFTTLAILLLAIVCWLTIRNKAKSLKTI